MSLVRQRLSDYLSHIAEAIERIDRYTAGMDEAAFLQQPLVQDAVVRNLEVIGEASNNIEKRHPDFAAAHSDLPLGPAYHMRNVLAHGYFKIDFAIVWKTIQSELPGLHAKVSAARVALASGGDA